MPMIVASNYAMLILDLPVPIKKGTYVMWLVIRPILLLLIYDIVTCPMVGASDVPTTESVVIIVPCHPVLVEFSHHVLP